MIDKAFKESPDLKLMITTSTMIIANYKTSNKPITKLSFLYSLENKIDFYNTFTCK